MPAAGLAAEAALQQIFPRKDIQSIFNVKVLTLD